jgi:hypothetical protein
MTDELSRIADRLRQNRTARQALSDAAGATSSADLATRAGTLIAGERALDIATGFEGVVEKAGLLDGLSPSDVQLRLANGQRVVRPARDVLWRPTPPGAV